MRSIHTFVRPDEGHDMAGLEITQLHLECPRCKGRHLQGPRHPRGDTKLKCAMCGDLHSFYELERAAIAKVQALLHQIGM